MQRPVTAMATDAMVPENKKAWQGEDTMADGSQHSCQKQLWYYCRIGNQLQCESIIFSKLFKVTYVPNSLSWISAYELTKTTT